mmetsp:Transcript_14997/g.23227  ORF Transcript_14997/g.23227 Transcript_14997/m.23227 type:complete len:84 (+) Transcript_14997:68-319(+)
MSNNAKDSLAPPESTDKPNKERKMTQAILDEVDKEKEVYDFLEDDDDFEEFENDDIADYDHLINQGGDVDMKHGGENFDRKLW